LAYFCLVFTQSDGSRGWLCGALEPAMYIGIIGNINDVGICYE